MNNVLFISNVKFSYYGSNGKTFLSFFNGLKDFRVSQLYFNKSTDESYDEGRDFLLSEVEIIKSFFLGTNRNQGVGPEVIGSLLKEKGFVFSILRILDSIKVILRDLIFLNYNLFNNNSFVIWLENQKPDIIFLAGADYIFNYVYASQISARLNIPLVIFFGDDFFIYNKRGLFFGKFYYKYFFRRVMPVIQSSEEIFVINKIMQEKYDEFFGRQTKILVQSSMKIHDIESKSIDHTQKVIFSYIGMIHSGRLTTLLWFADFLHDFNRKYKLYTQLKIYTTSEFKISDYNHLDDVLQIEKALIHEHDFISVISNTNFLVHVEGFDKKYISKVALSFSTKIVDYLQSNRCIVAVGPSSVASIDLLERYNLAYVLCDRINTNTKMKLLFDLISSDITYSGFCQRSSNYYKVNFRKEIIQENLRNSLLDVISRRGN